MPACLRLWLDDWYARRKVSYCGDTQYALVVTHNEIVVALLLHSVIYSGGTGSYCGDTVSYCGDPVSYCCST